MRTNPLIGPLVALLCLPFALGVAGTASMNALDGGGGVGSKPVCLNCFPDTQIDKEKSQLDYGCGLSSKNGTPYAILTGTCQRYQCSNGFYYGWSGWSATNRCSDHQYDAAPCPEGNCTQ
ncbi:hypothetical protein [Fimbriimonas ginsengisoli]|uniref:Secreted protein n=1 Tax=Fimbriimonas ginsengisoli Gsoil 348 TaxID=661478 RepID=A0A068NPM3_FIMGI|nr:hypothetical protein [Fimbriimonas ginsengisoli]AIE85396.1 hypothetical protein OP10G_2028 [Fimbriimonas ginsengisoli Gsoil 348]